LEILLGQIRLVGIALLHFVFFGIALGLGCGLELLSELLDDIACPCMATRY